ncbi:DUF2975 domain-containing protein [Opitutaceae bacterium]|nr:DUF2975 domain-containing protein [Opitutaceae bacterium]
MKSKTRSHYFSGWTRLFEWLLSLLLVIGTLGCAFYFAASAYLLFADQIPEFMDREILLEVGSSSYAVTPASATVLPFEPKTVEVEFPIPRDEPGLLLTHTGTVLIGFLFGLATLFQLLKFVRSLRVDHPFIPDNAHRLRCVAWLMLLGSIWKGGAFLIVTSAVSDTFPDLNLNITLGSGGIPLLTIFMFFIIAEVFALGVKMKEEADLTV